MDIQRLINRKKELKITNKELADISGVSLGEINKIFSGAAKHPRIDTINALNRALSPDTFYNSGSCPNDNIVKEAPTAYAASTNHHHTIDEYLKLPDDIRAELIDGNFIKMDAPSLSHQDITMELGFILRDYIKKNHGTCRAYVSPIDVRLDNDDYTMVQPDVLIVCDKGKMDGRRINGAPDFVAEVISPSSRSLDCIKKLNKYMNAGVREYWTLDFGKNIITVYLFENQEMKDINYYHFDDQVPVGICKDLVVDFAQFDIFQ